MREILFRGKRIDNGGWVEGVSVQHSDGDWQIQGGFSNARYLATVDPETVCQYTGLTDKNGRKIFEGDIILYEKKKYVIAWLKEIAAFASKQLEDTRYTPCMNTGTMKASEVIGNVFDNPDLVMII